MVVNYRFFVLGKDAEDFSFSSNVKGNKMNKQKKLSKETKNLCGMAMFVALSVVASFLTRQRNCRAVKRLADALATHILVNAQVINI